MPYQLGDVCKLQLLGTGCVVERNPAQVSRASFAKLRPRRVSSGAARSGFEPENDCEKSSLPFVSSSCGVQGCAFDFSATDFTSVV